MKIIQTTKLQKQVLETLASCMYAEAWFSDTTFEDLKEKTGISKRKLSGVIVSLKNAGYMYTDEEYVTCDYDLIYYLDGPMVGLVPTWVEELKNTDNPIEPVELIEYGYGQSW